MKVPIDPIHRAALWACFLEDEAGCTTGIKALADKLIEMGYAEWKDGKFDFDTEMLDAQDEVPSDQN